MEKLNLNDIVHVDFPLDQYIQKEFKKKQIVIHHSAGWDNAVGMFNYWASNKERVGTCVGIDDTGKIYQGFESKYYAWHINIGSFANNLPAIYKGYKRADNSLALEQHSIGIEICNWGGLKYHDGQYHTWVSTPEKPVVVEERKVICYPEGGFRGYNFFQRYTDQEIESLGKLLYYWCHRYNIDKSYHPEMWDICEGAISGQNGIWTHASYRADKSDCHPQPELIEMLKSL